VVLHSEIGDVLPLSNTLFTSLVYTLFVLFTVFNV